MKITQTGILWSQVQVLVGPPEMKRCKPVTWFTQYTEHMVYTFLPLTRQVLWDQMDCLRLAPYSIPNQSTLNRNP